MFNNFNGLLDFVRTNQGSSQFNEDFKKWLDSQNGDKRQLNNALYVYLGGLGYTGNLNERFRKWREAGLPATTVLTSLGSTHVQAGATGLTAGAISWNSQTENSGETIWTSGTDLVVPSGAEYMVFSAQCRSSNNRSNNTVRLSLLVDGVIDPRHTNEMHDYLTGGPLLSGVVSCSGVTDFGLRIDPSGTFTSEPGVGLGTSMRVSFY